MAKGQAAKDLVQNKIIEAMGNDFITIADKKIYVWSEENGEKVQVAIALTCPKTPVSADTQPVVTNGLETGKPAQATPVEISPEDKNQVARLKEMLGIT